MFGESLELFEEIYDVHYVNPTFLLAPLGFYVTFLIDKVFFLKEGSPHDQPPSEKVRFPRVFICVVT